MLSASKSGSGLATGYNLTRSLRFRSSATAYLNRTPASTGNRQTFTISLWAKRGILGSAGNQYLFGTYLTSLVDEFNFNFSSGDSLWVGDYQSADNISLKTTQVFRDPSAWYHLLLAIDTTQATSSNRVKLYVNGVQVTAFSTAIYPTQNYNTTVWNTSSPAAIGARGRVYTNNFDGYLAEVNFIDGQALTPSSFGSTNAVTGVWQPAKYTGTYGTNGFYLPFTDNSALTTSSNVGLGKDFSGNGNYWTTNNISITAGATYDSMTDVPTLTSATASNFAVLNPLDVTGTLTNGNQTLNSSQGASRSTIALPTTGKFYFESINTTATDSGGSISCGIGVALRTAALGSQLNGVTGMWGVQYYVERRYVWGSGGSPAYSTIMGNTAAGSVMQMCIDMDSGNAWVGLNNTWWGPTSGSTGDPSTNSNPTFTGMNSVGQLFALSMVVSNTTNTNFGQRPFTYTPPTGYVALCTYNLPTSTIVKGNTVMDATLYTGTLLSNAVTNAASFKPDLVWVKSRSAATDNKLTDSVRGVTKGLISNTTGAETTDTQGLTAFGSAGFTVGTNTDYNNLAATYVAWQWQAGQGSTSSNTSGSITSTVSVNASAGFSVVTFSATGSNATVGHGLGVAPSLVILKDRATANRWLVYHSTLGATQAVYMDLSNAATTSSTFWNNTAPTSSTVSIGTWSYSGNQVMYCWTPIAGFSAFGSYIGNGSSDGTFVYTGFRPRYVMMKRATGVGNWFIYDTARSTYNLASLFLYANLSDAEVSDTANGIDMLSNGFKLRVVGNYNPNTNGETFIYMAFAENPFKNSLAR